MLEKQNISISLAQGVDTKTDPNQVVTGKLVSASNVIFTEGMAFNKKNGYRMLSQIPSGEHIDTFQNELVSFDGEDLYSYSPTSASNINKGIIRPVNLAVGQVFRSASQQTQQDSAFNPAGLYIYVWVDSAVGAQYSVLSSETGQRIVAATNLPANSVKPHAWSLGNYLVITFVNSSTHHLSYISIPVINPTNPSGAVDLATNVNTSNPNYAGVVCNRALYLSWNASDIGGAVRTTYIDSTLNQYNVVAKATEAATACIAVFCDTSFSNPEIWVAYCTGTAIRYFILTSNGLATKLAPTAVVGTLSGIQNISGYSEGGSGVIYYQTSHDYSYASIRSDFVSSVSATDLGVVGSAVVFQRGVGMISTWFIYNGTQYAVFAYGGTLQPTYFVIDSSTNILVKLAYSNGGGYGAASFLTSANAVSDTSFEFSYLFKDLLETQQGVIYTQTGVNYAVIDFNIGQNFQSVESGLNLNITGGYVSAYDGNVVTEQGFHLFPEDLGATSSTGGSPAIVAGTYNYVAVYQWTDNKGNIQRSAYAPSISVVLASTSSITVNIPTLRLTAKAGVSITLYRDAPSVSTSIFYRVSSITSPTLNDKTVDSVAIVDNAADASIVGNEILYTTGGVIENIGPPAAIAMNIFKNRLMVVDAEDRNTAWYSKQVIEGVPVEFSDLFTVFVDPRFGGITALAVLDDKEIFFKANAVFYMTGNGPDNTGANNDFSESVFITSNVGCTNPASIVIVPDGLMFQSNKGVWLLDRSLGVSYIGAPVEAYNAYTVTSAQLIPNCTQVRFTLNTGLSLVYDYYYRQWDVPSTFNAASATLFQELHTYLSTSGVILQETPGAYLENNEAVLMSFATGWLSFAGLQGYQRAYSIYLLAKYLSPHALAISVAYDYNPAITQTSFIIPSQVNNSAYGNDPYYGSTEYFGGESAVQQWEIQLERQKCQSVQITVQELLYADNPVAGPGLTIEALGVVAGIKKSYPRLPAAKSVG